MKRRGRSSTPFSLFAFQDIITSVTAIIILITLILTLELLARKTATGQADVAGTAAEIRESIDRARAEIERLEARLNGQSPATEELATFVAADAAREISATQEQIEVHQAELHRLEEKLTAARQHQKRVEAEAFDQQEKRAALAEAEAETQKSVAKLEQLKQQNRLIYNPDSQAGKLAWLVDLGSDRILVAPVDRSGKHEVFHGSTQFLRWAQQRNPRQEYFVFLVRPSGIETHDLLVDQLRREQFDIGKDVISETQTVIDMSGA